MTNKKKNISKRQGVVFCSHPKDYKIFDIRSLKPKFLTSDMKNEEAPGMVLQEFDEIKFNGINKLQYFAPNNVGILLSIANKSLNDSKELFEKKINPNKFNHSLKSATGNRTEFLIEKSKLLYDYIEIIQSCIVFSYTAVEAFCNLSIPDNYEYRQHNASKGIVELYDKHSVERWLSLKLKVGTILVEIYNTDDIKKKTVWNHFMKLEQYRNDIIHQKSIDIVEFYKTYLNQDIFKVCESAQIIIDFFHSHGQKQMSSSPLWPWIINNQNHFPMQPYDSSNFEVGGNIYEQ